MTCQLTVYTPSGSRAATGTVTTLRPPLSRAAPSAILRPPGPASVTGVPTRVTGSLNVSVIASGDTGTALSAAGEVNSSVACADAAGAVAASAIPATVSAPSRPHARRANQRTRCRSAVICPLRRSYRGICSRAAHHAGNVAARHLAAHLPSSRASLSSSAGARGPSPGIRASSAGASRLACLARWPGRGRACRPGTRKPSPTSRSQTLRGAYTRHLRCLGHVRTGASRDPKRLAPPGNSTSGGPGLDGFASAHHGLVSHHPAIMADMPSSTNPVTSAAWDRIAAEIRGSSEVSTTVTPLAVFVSERR